MIGKVKTLLRVKQLKEDQAFRALTAKQAQVRQGEEDVARANQAIAESKASLPAREAAIWTRVIGRVVELADVDEVKADVKALEDAHGRLVDAGERAAHVLARLKTELAACVEAHRQATRNKDKYVVLRDEMVAEWQAEVDAKEENEVEDLFATRRRKVG